MLWLFSYEMCRYTHSGVRANFSFSISYFWYLGPIFIIKYLILQENIGIWNFAFLLSQSSFLILYVCFDFFHYLSVFEIFFKPNWWNNGYCEWQETPGKLHGFTPRKSFVFANVQWPYEFGYCLDSKWHFWFQ